MQKKIKKIIILLVVIMIILIFMIFIISKKVNNSESIQEVSQAEDERAEFMEYQADPSKIINGKKMEVVEEDGIYLTLERIIENYNNYLIQKDSKAIYNLLYDEYVKKNNISEENIFNKIKSYSNYDIIQLVGLSTTDYAIYYAKIEDMENQKFLMINWDTANDTFSLCPIESEEYDKGINSGIEVNKQRISSIELNSYNKVVITKVDSDDIANKYFYGYIEKMLHNTKEAYELLDEQYKEVSFPNYNDFKDYINNNKVILESLDHNNLKVREDFASFQDYEDYYYKTTKNKMKDYGLISENGIRTYTFEDSYGKYYIFTVTAAMKYTVMLDNYVIPTEDFTQTYNSSTTQEKVVLNIKKFFMGIDDKNYGYSYNLLADSFKNNKYTTKESFVNYAKQNFFEENEIEYIECKEQNGVYIYKIRLTDASKASAGQKEFNMIVKLNSGTDFEMSFGEN